MKEDVIFHKEFEGARFPERGSEGAAGMDFFIPNPQDTNDSCFEFMKQKCLEQTIDDEVKKAIEYHFNEIKGDDPQSAFLYAVSMYNKYVFGAEGYEFIMIGEHRELVLKPGQGINIPSGLSVDLPHGYALDFRNKSGIATKKSLVVGAELVDEDYTGVMHLNLHNIGEYYVRLTCGMKIAQAVFERTYYDVLNIKNSETRLEKKTDRGAGGFGSTGLY